MTLKRVPSFSRRPGFPSGLQVLVVDADQAVLDRVQGQLKELSYVATCCRSCEEALSKANDGELAFDIVLAEAGLVRDAAGAAKKLLAATGALPLVLMAAGSQAGDVWKGIELGAVDFLEKPLSTLKLRNIWQHTVRKMMAHVSVDDSCSVKGDIGTRVDKVAFGGPASPRTPSPAASGAESLSCRSSKACEAEASCGGSGSPLKRSAPSPAGSSLMDVGRSESVDSKSSKAKASKLVKKSKSECAPLTHRPPLAIRPSTFPMHSPMMPHTPVMPAPPGAWPSPPGALAAQPPAWGAPAPVGFWPSAPGMQPMVPCGAAPSTPASAAPGMTLGWGGPVAPMVPTSPAVGSAFMPTPAGAPMHRCHSAPTGCSAGSFSNLSTLSSMSSASLEPLPLDRSWSMDALFCDVLPVELGLLEPEPEAEAEKRLPIGLALKKSESFCNLINAHLAACGKLSGRGGGVC